MKIEARRHLRVLLVPSLLQQGHPKLVSRCFLMLSKEETPQPLGTCARVPAPAQPRSASGGQREPPGLQVVPCLSSLKVLGNFISPDKASHHLEEM